MGFPLRRTNHLSQQVPTSNEELPRPQAETNDFRQVLRKKHAAAAAIGARASIFFCVESIYYAAVTPFSRVTPGMPANRLSHGS